MFIFALDLSAALAEKDTSKRNDQGRARGIQAEKRRPSKRQPRLLQKPPLAEPEQGPVYVAPPVYEPVYIEPTKTIKVIFYDTTEAFRSDMRALTEKHGITYGGI